MIVRDSQFGDDAGGSSVPWADIIQLGGGIVSLFRPPPVVNTYIQPVAPRKSGMTTALLAGGAGLLLLTVVLATRH